MHPKWKISYCTNTQILALCKKKIFRPTISYKLISNWWRSIPFIENMQVLYDLVNFIWISTDKSVYWKDVLENVLPALFFITEKDSGELESGLGGFGLNWEVDSPLKLTYLFYYCFTAHHHLVRSIVPTILIF